MHKPIVERISQLEERRKAFQARLDREERAQATRRKILLGSFLLEQLERNDQTRHHDELRQWLAKELPAFFTRDADLALFADILEPASLPDVQDNSDDNDQR